MIKKIFFAAVAFLTAITGIAQQQQLPNDPATRVGKLDNGLTYYIRHNEKPAQRAEFYLATNVGALQEEPDQDGLAHFLEHMCFNGTKNFPGKGLLNWLESIGASFGGNVNASTGVEETIYKLTNIPLVRPTVVDTCVLIMHDYSHFVTCDPEEIDKERGVILEEKRWRNNAGWRMNRARAKYLYNDTQYSKITIIGTEEQLKTFQPESLTNFYHKWYRPDNQALIVVGDIDVDYVENCIKNTFADIPAPETPLNKEVIPIPDNEKPLIGVLTDPENQLSAFLTFWRSAATPEELNNTPVRLVTDALKDIIAVAMNERMEDLAASPEAPFVQGGLNFSKLCETADGVLLSAICKDEAPLQSLAASLLEAEKLRRFGLTDSEVERAKTEILSQYETAAKKADTRNNGEFIDPMIENFFNNKAFMDPQTEYQLIQQIMPMLTAEAVNQVAKQLITRENMIVLYQGVEKEGANHPTEEQIQAVIDAVENAELEQTAGEEIPTAFLDASKLKGSKASKVQEGMFGSKYFTLKNGVRVWLLPTDHEKDRIIFDFSKDGGRSLVADEDLYSIDPDSWMLYKMYAGVSEFPATLLRKMQAGKQLSLNTYFNEYTHGINGSTTVKDLEDAMQLAYLYFMEPRFDEAEYQQGRSQIDAILPNLVNTPDYKFQLATNDQLYDSPRRFALDLETAAKANLPTLERVYKSLYKDAAGARLVVVGDFDPDAIIPMICKYFGSIPKGKKATVAAYRGDGVTSADKLYDFQVAMPANKMVKVEQYYNLAKAYSVADEAAMGALRYILFNLYTETLREDEGGTYGADVNCGASFRPDERLTLEVSFDTNAESADKLRDLAKSGLKDIAENGVNADQFDKAVKNMQKRIPESRQRNNYWASVILTSDRQGFNYDKDYEDAVNALTPEKIQAIAQEILKGNLVEVVMRPE
uniref:Peptidase M16 inactive domain protein n=1 Tax=uncultured bacterium Contigcl_1493 TaxID=1393647 RepID=W0FQX5_9BACT|nr:peptidase M16 inactive domain protein [uncultured bacterium Contigcl_1493]